MAPRESTGAGPRGQESASVTSSFLLGNLHCPSCVSTIRDVLQEACAGHIRWVSPNIVTSVVTVEHDPAATLDSMTSALVDAGFEICGVTSSTGESFLDLDGAPQGASGVPSSAGADSAVIPPGAPATSVSTAVPLLYAKSGPTHTNQLANIYDMTGGPSCSSSSMPGASWGLSPLSRWLFLAPQTAADDKTASASQERVLQAHLDNCEQCRLQKKTRGKQKEKEQTEETVPGNAQQDTQDTQDTRNTQNTPNTQNTHVSSASRQLNTGSSTAISTGIDIGRAYRQQSITIGSTGGRKTMVTPAAADMEKSFVAVEKEDDPIYRPTWRANLAVGGMTCAVCVNTITDELKKRDWVSSVAVNLISNSATVEVDDESRVPQVVEAIEDLGYDAALDSVTRVNSPLARQQQLKQKHPRQHQNQNQDDDAASTATTADGRLSSEEGMRRRTVDIRIDGLYCEHCPDRIVGCLAGFRRPSLEILTKPTPQRPILQLSYIPEAPSFTIRHILAAIEACDAALSASIYHPPTLEERSRLIRAKHQQQILYRVILTGLTCIPTFVIGIVYMTLLPSMDHGRMFLMQPWTSGINRAQIAMFIMATPVYFLAADIFHVRAFKEIRTLWRRGSRTPLLQRFYRFGSMNTLISLGTTIAYVSSVSQMIAAAAHQASEINDANFYFDSVVFLTFFLLLGRLIEAYSKSKTGDAVEMLGRLRPTTAILVAAPVGDDKGAKVYTQSYTSSTSLVGPSADTVSGTTGTVTGTVSGTEVNVDLLEFGDVVRVLHGASPPADGVVVQGQSSFDESSLTGESRLVAKTAGDAVFSGTVNKDGPVLVRITGTSGASMLDQIVAVVREGQTKRAPMEQIADLLTTYFVPVVTLVAVLTWVIWLSLGLSGRIPSHYLDVGSGGWVAFSLQFAIAVFVVACPCGLGLAAPTAIFVAGGMAAKSGILAKGGGEAFEKASRIDCVVFDKTGTLTMGGEPTVTDAEIVGTSVSGNESRADILAALRAVEENSSHPIAKAIVSYCDKNKTAAGGRVDEIREIAGRGMRATFYGSDSKDASFDIIVGNEALMSDFQAEVTPSMAALLQQWKSEAKSVALAATRAKDGPWTVVAGLAVSDPVRPEAAPILAALQARGILVYMLSGDNAITAAAVARQLGIPPDQVIAEVLPTEKAAKIQALQASLPARTSPFGRVIKGSKKAGASSSDSSASSVTHRATVAMVGDGINDSPALTQADVGIAVGSGSDVAISSADFVLVQSNLQAVVTLLELSRAVFRRIAFNFGWALIYNVLAVPIAAGVLYPIRTATTNHIRLDPVWASLAMAMSSISVVLSSLALRSRIPGIGFRSTAIDVPPTH